MGTTSGSTGAPGMGMPGLGSTLTTGAGAIGSWLKGLWPSGGSSSTPMSGSGGTVSANDLGGSGGGGGGNGDPYLGAYNYQDVGVPMKKMGYAGIDSLGYGNGDPATKTAARNDPDFAANLAANTEKLKAFMINSGLIPGANSGGTNLAVPNSGASQAPSIGTNGANPLIPQATPATGVPPLTSSASAASSFPANGTPTAAPGAAGLNVFGLSNPGGGTSRVTNGQWTPNQKDFINAAKKAGYSAGDAAMLYNFLQSGAGFSPQAAQALIAAMQPGINRGEADITEQFSNMGLRNGSPAAIAMGDYLSQVQLDEGKIFAGMYEQSVQNYMNVLMGMKGEHTSGFDQLLKWISTSSNAAKAGAQAAG